MARRACGNGGFYRGMNGGCRVDDVAGRSSGAYGAPADLRAFDGVLGIGKYLAR